MTNKLMTSILVGMAISFAPAHGASQFKLIAAQGDAVNDPGGVVQRFNSAPGINRHGDIVVRGLFEIEHAMYGISNGEIEVLMQAEQPAPHLPAGVDVRDFSGLPSINDSGQAAFFADLRGPGILAGASGLYRVDSSGPTLLAATGTPIQGGGQIDKGIFQPVAGIDDDGRAVFLTNSVFGDPPSTLFRSGAEAEIIVQKGQVAPDLGTFGDFSNSTYVDGDGTIAIASSTTSPASAGLYRWNDGSLELLAQNGDVTDTGRILDLTSQVPIVNGDDDVAFMALVRDPDGGNVNFSILIIRDGVITEVVKQGSIIPGTDITISAITQYAFGDDGFIVFLASLTGPSINGLNGQAIIKATPGGKTEIVVQTDTDLAIRGGEFRAAAELLISSFSLNDLGVLAFQALLESETGSRTTGTSSAIYTIDLGSPIPVPPAALLMLPCLLMLVRQKDQRTH